MTTETLLVLIVAGIAFVTAFLVMRSRNSNGNAQEASPAVSAPLRLELESLRGQYNSLLEKNAGDQRELALKRERVESLEATGNDLQRMLADAQGEVKGLQERSTAALRNSEDIAKKLSDAERKLEEITSRALEAEKERSVFREAVRLKEIAFNDLEERTKKNDASLREAFENVSRKVMSENAEKFSEKSRIELENMLKPFKETLESTKGELQQSKGAAKEHEDTLKKQVQKIVDEADLLTRVFKGRDIKAFGDLGEDLLESVLHAAGLGRGAHYEVQAQRQNEDERNLKPDILVNLPDNKHLILDSKASLKNYNLAVTAEDKKEQKQFMEAFVEDILERVEELHEKHYPGLKGVRSPDFVMMYVPFEQAFLAALEIKPSLVMDAMRMKVAIVTNGTLLATLRTVSYVWSLHNQQRNAEKIAKQGGLMLDKFINFVDDLQKVRNSIKSCHNSVDAAWKKLYDGNGNLVSHAKTLHSMGVEGKKKPTAPVFRNCAEDEEIQMEAEEAEEEASFEAEAENV
jgi:DNA recombination protein RmuC